jgi:hypothetical protein
MLSAAGTAERELSTSQNHSLQTIPKPYIDAR